MTTFPLGRVGYYWSDKKSLKCNADSFKEICLSYGFELVKLDFERPLEEQGPFMAIVHKLFDFILKADNGDKNSVAVLEAFQHYVDDNPNLVVIDPLKEVMKLTDRYTQYICVASDLSKKEEFFIPAFVELSTTDIAENMDKLRMAKIDFPIHQKTIYFNSHDVSKPNSASELNELDDNEEKTPFIYPEKEKTDYIVEVLYKCLGLSLLGIDFIIDNKTGQYAVVDINYFPGYNEVDNFFSHLCNLIVKKISLKASGEDEFKCTAQLTQCVTSTQGIHQKFNFEPAYPKKPKAVISSIPRCLCCPISSTCLNGIHTEPKKPKALLQLTESHFHSLDCLQDDSGIETSDSCDEKKEPCLRTTMRRLHSRTVYSAI